MTRSNGMAMDLGLLAALLLLNVLFQFVPATEVGRLSTRTLDGTMEAIDAILPYDASVDEHQDEVIEQQQQLENQIDQAIEDITPDLVISLSADTVGLSTASTVETGNLHADTHGTSEIGPPSFTPVEVYPVCTYMPTPAYPEMARMAGVEGVVTLWVYVDRDGVVRDVQLMQTSGVSSLDGAALTAAMDTRWNPARNNNVSLGVWTTLRYNFSLTTP